MIPLTCKLHLVVNQQKSRVCSTKGIEFLGYQFTGYSSHYDFSPKDIKKFKENVREITRRNRGVTMSARLRKLGWYLRGWCNYFSLVDYLAESGLVSLYELWRKTRS